MIGALSARRAAVEARRVSKRFGEVLALDDVSLEIGEGDFFALLGPSGCGVRDPEHLAAPRSGLHAREYPVSHKVLGDLRAQLVAVTSLREARRIF